MLCLDLLILDYQWHYSLSKVTWIEKENAPSKVLRSYLVFSSLNPDLTFGVSASAVNRIWPGRLIFHHSGHRLLKKDKKNREIWTLSVLSLHSLAAQHRPENRTPASELARSTKGAPWCKLVTPFANMFSISFVLLFTIIYQIFINM